MINEDQPPFGIPIANARDLPSLLLDAPTQVLLSVHKRELAHVSIRKNLDAPGDL